MKFYTRTIKTPSLLIEVRWIHKDGMLLKTLEPIVYYRKGERTNEIIVPQGYTSDGATIPKLFWFVLSPFEDYLKCCILHDYLCDLFHLGMLERKECDVIFLEAMEQTGIKKSTRIALYFFVRLYALTRYNKLCLKLFGRGEIEDYNKEFFEDIEIIKTQNSIYFSYKNQN